jgi:hypothetical protein
MLGNAEALWDANQEELYRLVIEMSGERVEPGTFVVMVRSGEVTSITRNGRAVLPERTGDYSIDGLFGILHQELELAREPRLLGAPAGYQAYLFARFDPRNGRLVHYRRTVGGASNDIEIEVVEFEVQ